jgi:hypothetical protein
VRSRWAWHIPWLSAEPLRLLPWPEWWSRVLLPWFQAQRQLPPVSRVPALWERVGAAGASSEVLGWPGFWSQVPSLDEAWWTDGVPEPQLAVGYRRSLEAALEPFSQPRNEVLDAVSSDVHRLTRVRAAVDGGAWNVWVHLRTLSVVRRRLEPVRALDVREREVLDLALEFLDERLGEILAAAGSDTLVALVSPTGFEAPDSLERLRRLLGFGGNWRTTARPCPDGALVLIGEGVAASHRFSPAGLADVAPTLCYLLGLPVAQYMEGRVILDAIEPSYLARHPLRVVE